MLLLFGIWWRWLRLLQICQYIIQGHLGVLGLWFGLCISIFLVLFFIDILG